MSDVKRYAFRLDPMADCNCSAEEDRNGEFVEIEYYDALRSRLAKEEGKTSAALEAAAHLAEKNFALKARLASAEALLREARGRGHFSGSVHGVPDLPERIDAHLSRKGESHE